MGSSCGQTRFPPLLSLLVRVSSQSLLGFFPAVSAFLLFGVRWRSQQCSVGKATLHNKQAVSSQQKAVLATIQHIK
ncbi:hypothetical protein C8Q70DRAFT_585516 [Cubamyces menziesii]|nr:hypothetical protein C8Q70DRAFT_585516 [Cubamyces menziesii]